MPEGHIYQDEVETMLILLAAAPWSTTGEEGAQTNTAKRLVLYSWDVLYVRERLSAPLRRAMCKYVLIPVLEFCSSNVCREFYEQKIQQVMYAVEKRGVLPEEPDGELHRGSCAQIEIKK